MWYKEELNHAENLEYKIMLDREMTDFECKFKIFEEGKLGSL